ncbi:MAG: SDR family NAD(P)-dependent oxidoreductase [Bacteroidales bacterium]
MKKTVFISGATDGIGKATAMLLAGKNCRLLVHGRSDRKLKELLSELEGNGASLQHKAYRADFTSLSDIREMVQDIREKEKSIDILISNAGVYVPEKKLVTSQQIEKTFMVNQLAAFMLINGLLPMMKEGGGQILQVASMIHADAVDFENVINPEPYDAANAYAESKLCNILMVKDMAVDLKDKGILINSLHPGVINTKLLRAGWGPMGSSPQSAAEHIFLCIQRQNPEITGHFLMNGQIARTADFSDNLQNQKECRQLNKRLSSM